MRTRSIVILVVVVLAIATLAAIGGVVGANEPTTSTAAPTPTLTATSVQVTTTQLYTPRPTVKPTATTASFPTATPIPALSTQQKIANAIAADQNAVTYCFIVGAATTPAISIAGQAVTITSNVSSYPTTFNTFSDDRAENCIFYLQQDAWASDPSATQVACHVEILLVDRYGKTSVGDTAWAILTQATERQFVWANLSYTQAWAIYDQTWLLPGN